ncbi:hypothetical protein HYALB_00005587 [Hymenoscyphus albidus]|uniref:PAS domain-containing protein n=1 Tax=Hymenoscyphus albidus TaxID=595503 RepID=A0A9N9LJ67_9HELO|nr:hypothetical protein HYALB_00005587 [Hymenoscyphus albidus]
METTFITIHNLSENANILYASDSIVDILGYLPHEVVGRSCFDYFVEHEIPSARSIHNKSVELDKAAVLHYATIKGKDGRPVYCECVFTVVYQVLVACTSIYRNDVTNERRALEAPNVQRLFASPPKDPRYHMAEHLRPKFEEPPQESLLEPRAALILNRFTRTLSIMYATSAVESILGLTVDELQDRSFYACIQENCLPEALRCLESAKSNDSIAYLRFWYRDPRTDDEDLEEGMREASASSDSDDGGVDLRENMDVDTDGTGESSEAQRGSTASGERRLGGHLARERLMNNSRTSSGESSTDLDRSSSGAVFDRAGAASSSSTSSIGTSHAGSGPSPHTQRPRPGPPPFEIEAVISCTSDGLVVVLRRARVPIPPQSSGGVCAAPWGVDAIRPHAPPSGPPMEDFMAAIQEIAVFAWALTGINGNIAAYGRGNPRGEAQPPGGLPIWDPYAEPTPDYQPPENQAQRRWVEHDRNNAPIDESKTPYQHIRQDQTYGRMTYEPRVQPRHHRHRRPNENNAYQRSPHSGGMQGGSHGQTGGNHYNPPAPDGSGGRNAGNRNNWY